MRNITTVGAATWTMTSDSAGVPSVTRVDTVADTLPFDLRAICARQRPFAIITRLRPAPRHVRGVRELTTHLFSAPALITRTAVIATFVAATLPGNSASGTAATVVAGAVVAAPRATVVVVAGFFVLPWFLNELHGVVVVVVVVVVEAALARCIASVAPTGGVPGMDGPVK